MIDTCTLKIGDALTYIGKSGALGAYTTNSNYIIINFYDSKYGIITVNDKGEESKICMSLVKQYFKNSSTESKYDPVSRPSHYCTGNIECIDAMQSAYGKEAVKDFCICNAFKYLWRFKYKNKEEDINKMLWYINKYKDLNNE